MKLTRARIEKVLGSSFIDGNSVELLGGGKGSGRGGGRDAFSRIFESVRGAKEIICLEFYIFRNDETGEELAELLKERAARGVPVYVLYDHFGSFGTPRAFWAGLREAGVKVRASHPFKLLSPRSYIHRDHRKLLIVDGTTVFTGGLNIANEYRRFKFGRRRRNEPWRDTAIIIRGPASVALYETFRRAWALWRGRQIGFEPSMPGDEGELPLIPIFALSGRGRRRMRRVLYYSINNSTESILLTTAYFTPTRRMMETLVGAARRGVRVRLLVPEKSDIRAADHAGRAFFSQLLRAGVEIYEYRGEMMHAKSYVFDGYWSIVGSANLDLLSLRANDEGNVGIADRGFARKLGEMFEDDLTRSARIDRDAWRQRPFMHKVKEYFFSQYRRWL